MTQRIFDVENEKDMADLWSILPDRVFKIHTSEEHIYYSDGDETQYFDVSDLIAIKWHDKTEITRPMQEATEADIGKLCWFWEGKDFAIGVLKGIGDDSSADIYCMEDSRSGVWFMHARRLTKQEIEELC
jgi:hypothetical protein